MNEIYVALISTFGLVIVAYFEHGRRSSKQNWEDNKADHNFVVDKIETVAKSLVISIDRVENTALRTEAKIDEHIRDHAVGEFRADAPA
jgi:hypothetical protein